MIVPDYYSFCEDLVSTSSKYYQQDKIADHW